jgi:Tfp pilus assembly protein PilF
MSIGMECARQGDSEGALAAAEQVLAIRPDHDVARLLRAQSRQALGEAEGVASDYRTSSHVTSTSRGLV